MTKKIEHYSLSEKVYRELMKRILASAYKAGQRMREETICEELGVSRTPVRESLIRLVREGVLEQRPRCGCIVRQLPEKEINDLLECRKILECLILRKYFDRLDMDKIKKLERRLSCAEKKDDDKLREELLQIDEALHDIIIESCDNSFLSGEVKKLKLLCRPYRVVRCAEEEDISAIIGERRGIMESILDNDPDGSERLLVSHFDRSKHYYLKKQAEEDNL